MNCKTHKHYCGLCHLAQVWTHCPTDWIWVFNFQWQSYSKFNISHTLGLKSRKSPPQYMFHHRSKHYEAIWLHLHSSGLSNKTKRVVRATMIYKISIWHTKQTKRLS
jgi:hypothetical protein